MSKTEEPAHIKRLQWMAAHVKTPKQIAEDLILVLSELESLKADAQRYQFLKPLYTCIDFEYGDSSEGTTPSIVFAIPPGTRWSGDLDKSIDAALSQATQENKNEKKY